MGAGASTYLSTASADQLSSDFNQLPDSDQQKLRDALAKSGPKRSSSVRKPFVGTNWKCSLESCEQVGGLLSKLAERWPAGPPGVELCIFPPYVFLDRARQRLSEEIKIGSQGAWDAAEGFACTGVTTAAMLQAVGCSWVLLGHSDRRNVLGESDALIADKVKRCLDAGLNVNLTIGEKTEAREAGEELNVLQKQLSVAAGSVPADAWHRIAVAYEPVWAVGEGATPCSPEETQRVLSSLRNWLRSAAGDKAADECRFLYTGSVSEKNADEYAKLQDVDGFVVGRAGLDVDKLASICETLVNAKQAADGALVPDQAVGA